MIPVDPKYGTDLRFAPHQTAISKQLRDHGFGLQAANESLSATQTYPIWELRVVVTTKARVSRLPWAPKGTLAAFCESLTLSSSWPTQGSLVDLCPQLVGKILRFTIDRSVNQLDVINITLMVSGREPTLRRPPTWV